MALNRLTEDVNVISKLDNYPPDDPGMTPDKLKSLFDKGSNTIKDYINNALIPQLEAGYISSVEKTSGDGSAGTTDTYTITFHDGNTITFDVYNGADGVKGDQGERGEKGDKGDPGADGANAIVVEAAGQYVFQIIDGDLLLIYDDNAVEPPSFYINELGELIHELA